MTNANLCICLFSNDDDDRSFVFGWLVTNIDVSWIDMTNKIND